MTVWCCKQQAATKMQGKSKRTRLLRTLGSMGRVTPNVMYIEAVRVRRTRKGMLLGS